MTILDSIMCLACIIYSNHIVALLYLKNLVTVEAEVRKGDLAHFIPMLINILYCVVWSSCRFNLINLVID